MRERAHQRAFFPPAGHARKQTGGVGLGLSEPRSSRSIAAPWQREGTRTSEKGARRRWRGAVSWWRCSLKERLRPPSVAIPATIAATPRGTLGAVLRAPGRAAYVMRRQVTRFSGRRHLPEWGSAAPRHNPVGSAATF
jgi:hypothetical protein